VRILHTADWHVGRTIRGRSRADEHRAVLAEIAGIAATEGVDAVLVVGDLFDTAAPTAESEQIVYEALLALAATGATVVVLAGNHDSDRRLNAVRPLLELGHVVTRPVFAAPDSGGVVELRSRDGRDRALLACVPFLSQRWVVRADDLVNRDAAEHQLLYAERMRRVITALTTGFTDANTIHLLAAHAMILGAETVGSERAGQSVFEYSVAATAFPTAVQYVALGHLHRPQQVAGPVPARYSGSALALDFGETKDVKSVTLVDVVAGKPAIAREVELTSGRRLRVVEGSLAELQHLPASDDWLKVVVREKSTPGLADEVRTLLPHAVDVTIASGDAPKAPVRVERAGRSPQELFAQFLDETGADDPALRTMFAQLYDEVGSAS
jgi:exonuclease SbcD